MRSHRTRWVLTVGTALSLTACREDPVRPGTNPRGGDPNATRVTASYVVSNLNDAGPGSLRQAILDANADGGPDDITFTVNGTITLASTLTVTDAAGLTIHGTGQTLNGNSTVGIMTVAANAELDVDNLTFFNGNGGAFPASGGISMLGAGLVVRNSTFTNNSSDVGGALNLALGYTTVENSTITGNEARQVVGGGIAHQGTSLTIVNTTITGNTGSGINSANQSFVYNSTITNNSANGIQQGGTLTLANTILAGNAGDCSNFGTIVPSGANLVGDGSCAIPGALSGDPKLGVLSNNGGPTQTQPLLSGSPAINAGSDAVCAASLVNGRDQRGVTRPQGAHCDLGAYELVLGNRLAYLWAQTASPTIGVPYAPDAQRNYNGKGLPNSVTRVNTGVYTMKLGGMAKAFVPTNTETFIVTAYSQGKVRCNVLSWGDLGADLQVTVQCAGYTGAPVNSRFSLLMVGDNSLVGRLGFAWADQPTSPQYSPSSAYAFNSSGLPISISRGGTGSYNVDLGLARPGGGLPESYLTTAFGNTDPQCSVTVWAATAFVGCYSRAAGGQLTDARYNILHVEQGRPGMRFGFAWADQPTAPTTYAPNPNYATSTGGAIAITRTQKGVYTVDFAGLEKPVATRTENVQVSAIGSGFHACTVPAWPKTPSGTGLRVWVVCRNAAGLVEDSYFTVLVVE